MSEILAQVVDRFKDRPATAIIMSGSGSNAETILDNPEIRELYDIRLIATDNPSSRASELADQHSLEMLSREKKRIVSVEERELYFRSLGRELGRRGVEALIYAGFMKIATDSFCREFPGVNVHPADLTIKGVTGTALFRGMNALPLMRADTGGELAASVHVVDTPVDTGSVISVSNRIACSDEWSDAECHQRLKTRERSLYPRTLTLLGRGMINPVDLPLAERNL